VSLNKLEMVGFKSFMSPVTLRFNEGITAILGPNGCGKTNIVDAVRWVLGEQSSRQLRSTKMENVIFNGTQLHKPKGCAIVNLTLNNERGLFPIDYSEVTITRKVYRSGISEYFLNKTPCRLKDIKEFFADTGTGSHSYAVIEQEMMDYVLNDAHGDRRQMFEEVAGIVKYRMRREEAKRKLKLTESDLVRLEDIIEELGKQVRSLRYQVGKAKRFKTIREKIKHWELVLIRKTLAELLGEKRRVESELAGVKELSEEGGASLEEMERLVESEKLVLLDMENGSTEKQNRRYEIRRRIQVCEEKVIQLTERRGEAIRNAERAGQEIAEAKNRLAGIAERMDGVDSEMAGIMDSTSREEHSIRTIEEECQGVSDNIEVIKPRLMEHKQTRLDFIQDQVRIKSSLEHYESILENLETRASEIRERVIALEVENAALMSERKKKESEMEAVRARLADTESEREDVADRLRDVEKRVFELEKSFSERRADLARLNSRHDLVVRMQENFEGFSGGARYVLEKNDDRVRGPIAELFKVEDKYRPALEAVLGGILDGVVVDTFSSAMDLMAEISEKGLGRIRLFPEDGGGIEAPGEVSGADGLIGPLSSLVEVRGASESLAGSLLGRTYVFENADHALKFMSKERFEGYDAVTLSGMYFCSGKGIYYSGSSTEEISLLGRSEEIAKMKKSMSRLEERTSALEMECTSEREKRETFKSRIREMEASLVDLRSEAVEKGEELREVERDHVMKSEKRILLLKSLEELETSRMETLSKLEEARLTLQMKEDGEGASRLSELESELALLQSRRKELQSALAEKKVQLVSLQGSMERKREEKRGLQEMERQFREIIEQREIEISSSGEEAAGIEKIIEEERSRTTEWLEGERTVQQEIDELSGSIEEKRNTVTEIEKELKRRQVERESIFSRENEIRIGLSSIETRIKDLVDKGMDVFHEDLGCYLSGEQIPVTEDENGVTPEALDREKKKLESLGPVNLAAVEEYNEKKERLDFLSSQRDDLVKAKDELNEAIRKINRIARKCFTDVFGTVRKHFHETFKVLFEGGEADLMLSEDSDPLEADIIIKARPKGKRFQDISLLSGGERALTSLALLFALYRAKPSPFCIFDEVDAPLDDANIQRFVRMLREFQDDTQFIIITHNKHTMEAASMLYGVTMEEKGVSSLVSVNLESIEEVIGVKETPAEVLVEHSVSPN